MDARWLILVATALAVACGDTDVDNRGGEIAPGQEVEDSGVELDVEPVDLDTLAWFRETGTVEFDGRSWFVAGEPLFDPAVTRVGEYRGTPLYAEVGVAPPYDELFIPLENDYWQMLEQGAATDQGPGTGTTDAADTGGAGG